MRQPKGVQKIVTHMCIFPVHYHPKHLQIIHIFRHVSLISTCLTENPQKNALIDCDKSWR